MANRNSILRKSAVFIVVIALAAAAVVFQPELVTSLGDMAEERAVRIWSKPYFHLGELPVTPAFILKSILFLLVLTVIARLGRRLVRRAILDRTFLDEGQRWAIERTAGYLIFGLGLVVGVDTAGVSLASLAFLGGAVGIVIGFGLQNIANNFVSGLILLFDRPIKVGDRIEVGNLNGDVTRIGARSTWIRTNDNVVIIVPNSDFISNRVTNWTANDRRVRFAVDLGVSYGSDPEHVREILASVAAAHSDVLREPSPEVLFVGFGDSSLDFELRVWTRTQVQTPKRLKSDLYFTIFRRFREEGIEIPFPQRDLHLRSVEVAIPVENNLRQADAGLLPGKS